LANIGVFAFIGRICLKLSRSPRVNLGIRGLGGKVTISPKISPGKLRRIILEQSKRAHVGHIGSSLCVVEILAALYGGVLRGQSPDDPDRDRFVLSKGHAALALYATLALKGWVSDEQLATFCGDGSLLGVHPEAALPGIDFCSGSLGHGLSIAAGAALAARIQGSDRRAFCLISDGECNEGSVWESAMFAAHNRLSNLFVVADINGQQALGLTRDVCAATNMRDRWQAFGWDTAEVDGHSIEAITAALNAPGDGRPRIVLARTIFGCGVPFMEQGVPVSQKHLPVQPINWHYLPMSDEEYAMALSAVGQD
jgi:transketolase